jgi:hypothetical protein
MSSSHPTGFIFFALMEEVSTLGRPLKNNYALKVLLTRLPLQTHPSRTVWESI